MDELAFLSATELVGKLRNGEISSRELTEHYIHRIEIFDDEINAVVVRDFDRALGAADEADKASRQSEEQRPLHGLPMTVKESFALAGTATTFGFSEFADNFAECDAVAV